MSSKGSAHAELGAFAAEADRTFFARLHALESPMSLSPGEKLYLLEVCRIAVRDVLAHRSTNLEDFVDAPEGLTSRSCVVFVSLHWKGKLKGCWSKAGANLVDAAIHSARAAALDARRDGALTRAQFPETRIEVSLLFDGEALAARDLASLTAAIDLGAHGISVEKDDQRAFYKADVAITDRVGLAKLLARLCKKAGLAPDAYQSPETRLVKYRSVQFSESFIDRAGDIQLVELFRGCRVVPPSAVKRTTLESALRLSGEWVRHHIDEAGRLTYEYEPARGDIKHPRTFVEVLRCLMAAWILVETGNFFNSYAMRDAALRQMRYVMANHLIRDGARAYVAVSGVANLGVSAFLLLGLVALPEHEPFSVEIRQLVEFIFSMEDQAGGFLYPRHLPSRETSPTDKDQLFYPGEALTALAALFDRTADHALLGPARRVFPFYRSLYETSPDRSLMAAWMSKPYRHLFGISGDPEHAQFVLRMNDDLVESQIKLSTHWPDHAGAWYPGRLWSYSTGVFLESILEGLAVANAVGDEARAQRYRESCLCGLRYLLQVQISPEEVFNHERRHKLAGGLRMSPYNHLIRVDDQSHAGCAFLKAIAGLGLKY